MNAWAKLWRNPLGAAGILVIALSSLSALFAYHLVPDASPNANQMELSLANRPPGFTVPALLVPQAEYVEPSFIQRFLYGAPPAQRFFPFDSLQVREDEVLGYWRGRSQAIPSRRFGPHGFQPEIHQTTKTFYLGTDRFGRDLLSRLLLGGRVSLSVGMVAVFISLLIGIPLGAAAGYYGGWTDKLILWFINVVWSIPGLMLVIAITLALGKGFWQVFVAIGFTMWVEVARVVRGQILGLKEKEFVQAARVLGYSDLRILWRHILPNVVAPLIVISAANFAAAILIESGLSFLGIGAQPPTPSWGGMIKDHYAYLIVDKAYLAVIPGTAIMLLVLSFMLLGNALRDALDVRQV